jgi:DNA-binding NarL/FixJ family response regulator
MRTRVPVQIHADDPLSDSGVRAQLRARTEVHVLDPHDSGADVALVVVAELDEPAVRTIRRVRRSGCDRVVVIAGRLDEHAMLGAVEAGACGMMRRSDASPERLVSAVRAAAGGDGSIPPDLLGRLLEQVGQLQRQVLRPQGLMFNGLSEREVDVLRLLADGCDTAEIATTLAYSERTVKKDIQNLTTRLRLRNRSHAVAYAMREGII